MVTAIAHIGPISEPIKSVIQIAGLPPFSAPRDRNSRPPLEVPERPVTCAPHKFHPFASRTSETCCNGHARKAAPRQGTGLGAEVGSITPQQPATRHSAIANWDCSIVIAQATSAPDDLSLEAQPKNCERSNAPNRHRQRDDNSNRCGERSSVPLQYERLADVTVKRHHMRTV